MTSDGSRPLSGAVSSSCTNSHMAGRGEAHVGSVARDKKKLSLKRWKRFFCPATEVRRWALRDARAVRCFMKLSETQGSFSRAALPCSAKASRPNMAARAQAIASAFQRREKKRQRALSLLRRCPHTLTPCPWSELSPTATLTCKDSRGTQTSFRQPRTNWKPGALLPRKRQRINMGGQLAVCGRGSGQFLIPVPSGHRLAGALNSPLPSEPSCVSSCVKWDDALD